MSTLSRVVLGVLIAVGAFVVLGTVAALWENSLFIRMTPPGGWEIGLLAVQSALLGSFFALRPAACSAWSGTTGGILGFFGIACPICNKVLMLFVGGELLLAYFEPVRVYVAALGVAVTAAAVIWILHVGRKLKPSGSAPVELPGGAG